MKKLYTLLLVCAVSSIYAQTAFAKSNIGVNSTIELKSTTAIPHSSNNINYHIALSSMDNIVYHGTYTQNIFHHYPVYTKKYTK